MMQVENRLSAGLQPGALSSTPLKAQAPVSSVANSNTRHNASFPDAPLISAQPLRYNVQLNQQLTRVQQADHFLQATESQLLKVSHALSRRGERQQALAQTSALQSLLAQRQTLSGGSVNRQLQVTLEGKSQVEFSAARRAGAAQQSAAGSADFFAGRIAAGNQRGGDCCRQHAAADAD